MPTVAELSAPYGNFMIGPRHARGVCERCFNLTRDRYRLCYACAHTQNALAAIAPISYSVAGEQLHRALWGYKHLAGEIARRLRVELAAVLWRHLTRHEGCISSAAGIEGFELVTTVPSGWREDGRHPLQAIVGELVGPTRERHRPLLARTPTAVPLRESHPGKYLVTHELRGEPILLIDDTWTSGASAQSAAAALRQAGSGPVAAVVIGRHLNRDWHENDRRLRTMRRPFDWDRCALCAG